MNIFTAFVIILLLVFAGINVFLAQFNADELNDMGVEKH